MSTQTETGTTSRQPRPVSIPHLIFGVVFTGMALVWAIGEATNADLPRTAIGFPAVLIGAGLVGLVATVVNARRRARAAVAPVVDPDGADTAITEDTTVLTTEGHEPTVVLDDGIPSTHEEK